MRPILASHLLVIAAMTIAAMPAFAASSGDARHFDGDPYFREALFHAHQGRYFEALERLDAELAQHYGLDEPGLDSLFPYLADAEFSVGDFELRYRMHARAGRAIRAVLEGNVDEAVRADAAYRLARIHFQKGQADDALAVLDSIAKPMPKALRQEVEFLRANALLALDRPGEAVDVLRGLQSADTLAGYAAYNLGIALLDADQPVKAALALDRAGKRKSEDRESRAIRDKANLVLGTLLFDAGEFSRAGKALERIRLDGPFSNQALLRAGWAAVSAQTFERAVVPWSILAERDPTDPAVQEAQIALPFAYSKLEVHSRAAVLYERAVASFGQELAKLDASLASIREGDFLEALEREEIRKDKDWVVRLRSLPESPETYYLVGLMASHDFQTALQNYLDLADMRRKLLAWQRSLDAFDDMIALRHRYYEPRLPDIDVQFRKLDAQMRVRLEQRRHLDERLTKMLTAPAPELLATSAEHADRLAIEALQQRLVGRQDEPGVAAARRRLDRLAGVLSWRLTTRYHERLTEVHDHLRQLNENVEALDARYERFVRTRQAATHSYVGYDARIDALRVKVREALARLVGLRKRQGAMLEQVAIHELTRRRAHLEASQNKARFAFADSYDRAAKKQVPAAMRQP